MEFTFQPELSQLDIVPENMRLFYAQDEETKTWKLRDDDITKASVSIISGQQGALKKVRVELDTAKKSAVDLAPLATFGDNPLAIAEAFSTQLTEAKGAAGQDVERQVAKIKEDLAKGHATDLENLTTRNGALETQLFNIMGSGAAKEALKTEGVINPDLMMHFMLEQLKSTDDDGKFGVQVVDGQGDVRYSGLTGKPMSVAELVTEMKGNAKYAPLFKSEAPVGGGPKPGAASGKPPVQGEPEKSPTDKIAAGLKRGLHQGAAEGRAADAQHGAAG